MRTKMGCHEGGVGPQGEASKNLGGSPHGTSPHGNPYISPESPKLETVRSLSTATEDNKYFQYSNVAFGVKSRPLFRDSIYAKGSFCF